MAKGTLSLHIMSDWVSIDRLKNFAIDDGAPVEVLLLQNPASGFSITCSKTAMRVSSQTPGQPLNLYVTLQVNAARGKRSLRSGKGSLGSIVYAFSQGAFYSDPSHDVNVGVPPQNYTTIVFEPSKHKKGRLHGRRTGTPAAR